MTGGRSRLRGLGDLASGDLAGAGLVVLTSLQFGAVVILGKLVTRTPVPIPAYLALRFGMATILLAAVLTALRQPLRAAPGEGWRLAALGMAGYAVEAVFFFLGLEHGTAAAVTLLFFTYPVVVALVTFAMRRGLPGWLLGGALAASMGGVALVVVASGGVDIEPIGVVFSLASAVTFGLYLLGADAVLERTNSLAGAMWVSGSAAVALAVFALVSGNARAPGGWDEWGPIVGTGVFTSGAFVTLFAGLRRLGAVRTSILSATEPLAATVLAAVLLDEAIGTGTIGGGALILAGAVAASLARRRAPAEPPVP